jgi:hypothetical protein
VRNSVNDILSMIKSEQFVIEYVLYVLFSKGIFLTLRHTISVGELSTVIKLFTIFERFN